MDPNPELPGDAPVAPPDQQPQPPADRHAHLRNPNRKRGRGAPFTKGDDLRRLGFHGPKVKLDRRSTASLLHEITTNVLLNASTIQEERGRKVCRMIAIVETLADKAEKGDIGAAEMLLDRFGGKVKAGEEAPNAGSGRIVIEWNGPPLPWMPQPAATHPALAAPPPDEPKKGSVVDTAPNSSSAGVIDTEVVDADQS